jgi:hypothetical protein
MAVAERVMSPAQKVKSEVRSRALVAEKMKITVRPCLIGPLLIIWPSVAIGRAISNIDRFLA